MKKRNLLLTLILAVLMPWAANAQETLTVCDGSVSGTTTTTNNYVPIYGLYVDTQGQNSEFIIPAETQGMSDMEGGTISKLAFYIPSVPNTWGSPTVQVYMGEVEGTTLSSLNGPTNFTTVWTGTLSNQNATMEITLSTPYTYEGGNLLIGMYVQTKSSTYQSTGFSGISAPSGSSRYNSGSGSGTAQAFIPKTTFTYEPAALGDCEKPETLVASNVTGTSATLTWSGGSGTYNMEVKGGEWADWTEILHETNLTTTSLTLQPTTSYQARVQSVCTGSTPTSTWKSVSFTTPCASYDIPYTYDFEAEAPFACWTPIAGVTRQTSYVNNGSYSLKFSGTTSNMIALPQFTDATNTLRVEFWTRPESNSAPGTYSNYSGKFAVGYMTDMTDASTFVAVETYNSTEMTTSYVKKTVDLTNAPAGANIAMRQFDCATNYYWFVDDVTVKEIPSCLAPTGLAVSTTATGFRFTWDAEQGAQWGYSLSLAGEQHGATMSVGTNNYMDINIGQSYCGVAVDYNTDYVFYVSKNCGGGNLSEDASIAFRTPCGAYDIPYTYDFEEAAPFACWTPITGVTRGSSSSNAHSGTYYIRFSSTTSNLVALPQFNEATNNLRVEFWTRPESTTNSNCGTFSVGYMTDITDASTFVEVANYAYNDWTSATYVKKTVDFNNAPTNANIAFRHNAGSSSWYWYADDVTVKEIPSCVAPTGLAANVSATSAELSWTANSSETAWTLYWKKTSDENYTVVANANSPYLLNGLTAGTDYQFYVVANCSADETSEPSEVFPFTTECVVITITESWSENFNSLTAGIPNCWDNSEGTTTTESNKWNYFATGHEGAGLRFNSYSNLSGNTNFLKTPTLNFPAFKVMQLSFWYKNPTGGDFSVYISTDGGNTYATLATGLTGASAWTLKEIVLTNYVGAENVIIEFKGTSNYGSGDAYIYLDDVAIVEAPTCFQPQNLAVTEGSITAHEATLTWQPNSNGTENAWVLQCCESSDFICGNSGMFEVSDTPTFTLTGLTPEHTYYVRVKPDCDTEGELWSDVVSFTTLALCPAPTGFAVASVNAHTARFEWQGTSESYSVSYRTAASLDATFEEHFTGLTSGIPTGWDNNEGATTTDSYKWSYYNSGHDAAPCVRFNSFNNGNGNTNFLKTPSMDFPAFTTMILSFWWKNPTGGDFSVYISTDGGATRALLKEGMTGQSTWKQETIILSDYVGASNVFIYFKGTSNWGNGDAYIYLDDVVLGSEVAAGDWQTFTGIEESPYTIEGLLAETTYEAKIQGNCGDLGLSQETDPITFTTGIACYPPLGATYYPEDLKSDQVKLYWNGGDGTYYQLCLNGDESNLIDVEGTVYTWEGLDPETEYTVKVRSNCELSYPGDGVSEWSGTLTFTTLPDCAQPDEITFQAINHYDATLSWMGDSESFTVNYRTTAGIDGISEEFKTTSAPEGWTRYSGALNDNGTGPTSTTNSGWSFGTNQFSSIHAYMNMYSTWKYWLVTPSITIGSDYNFSFDVAYTAYNSTNVAGTTGTDDRFLVLISTDEKAHWTILREWNNDGTGDAVLNDIPATFQTINDIDLSAYAGQTVYIAFYGGSTESNTDNTLRIDNVMIGTPIAAGEWQTVTTDQARATIENLTPGTEYEVVVVPSCDENAASDPVNFTTIDENKKIFILPGDWSTASNWMDNEIPTIEDDVTLRSNATVTGDAFAKSITGTGTGLGTYTLTIEDGGSLACDEYVYVTMKKTIHAYPAEAGNRAGYYLIAQPNTSATAPTNLGMITTESDYDLFAFDYKYEGAEWRNYKVQSFNLEYGKGYLYANAADVELSYTGQVRESKTGIYTMANYDDEDEYSFNGWTLVGNPFPCKATVSLGSSSMHYYRMNENGDDYIADNGPINPWEGIFAQTPNQTYRVTFYRYEGTKASSSLNINLSMGGKLNVRDRAVVRFDEGNTLEKMQFNPNHSKVFIPQDGKDYAVVVAEGNIGEVPVSFMAEHNGSYTLSFTSEEVSFSYLHLIDNKTGNDVNLLQTPYYTFDASTSDYESRFRLMFATGSSVNDGNFGFVNAMGNFCIFGIEGEATLQVIDVLGHVLSTEQFSGSYEKRLNVAPGVYMIRLIQGNDIKVQKMVVR